MRQELYCRSLVIASSLAVSLASAQSTTTVENPSHPNVEEAPAATPLNRFGLNYRMGFNISARFKHLGGYPALSNPNLTPNNGLWNYDNGYIFEDIQGNNSPFTWYWGYSGVPSKAAQVPGDGFLYLSRSSSLADVDSGAVQDNPQLGSFEVTYNREFGHLRQATWGVEAAFNYMNLTIRDNRPLFGNATVQSDAYALNGVVPPDPPYFGTFEGPVPGGPNRPVISQDPTPGQGSVTTMPNGVSITGERKLEADIYGFRIGPYAQVPITDKISLWMSAGLAGAFVQTQFKFNEIVTIPGVGSVVHTGSGSHGDFLVGGYAGGTFSYAFSKAWSATAGAQYQVLTRYSQQVGGKVAELDLQSSIFVTVGLGYSF